MRKSTVASIFVGARRNCFTVQSCSRGDLPRPALTPLLFPPRPFRVRLRNGRQTPMRTPTRNGRQTPMAMARSAVGGSIACCPPCRCGEGEPLEQASCPLGAVLLPAPWHPPTPPHLPLSFATQTPKHPSLEDQPVTFGIFRHR